MAKQRRLLYGLSLVLLLVAFGMPQAPGFAAGRSSTVRGTVLLASGQPASGAWLRVQTTDNLVYADPDGSFALSGLPEGIGATVTGWYPEHKVGWATVQPPAEDVTITLQPYDTRDNRDYEWNTSYPDPANPVLGCGHCMQPAFNQWQHTAHAGSATSQRFLSLYNGTDLSGTLSAAPGYKQDFPGTAGNCATCHAPGAAYDAPYTSDMNALTGVAREGIFCEFCHKVGAVYLNPATDRPYENAPGTMSMRLYRPQPGDQIFFGSLDDVNRRVSYLPLEQKSEFCAPCHQFSFWGTPIYESYREWQESPYPALGIECQTCHMPPGDDAYFVLPEKGGLPRNPERLASHRDLGIKDIDFMTATVAMSVTAHATARSIHADVTITNIGAGHHVPTDYPGRQLILTVEATDALGQPLTLAEGSTVPEWGGAQAGMPGKVYVKLLRDAITGEVPAINYWKQTMIVRDTRLEAMATDTTFYRFAAPEDAEPVDLLVELRFRRNFADVMKAKAWNEPDIVLASRHLKVSTSDQQRAFMPLLLR